MRLHSKQFKKNNGFETLFPYHTMFPLIIGYHLGRHLGYQSIKFICDNKEHNATQKNKANMSTGHKGSMKLH